MINPLASDHPRASIAVALLGWPDGSMVALAPIACDAAAGREERPAQAELAGAPPVGGAFIPRESFGNWSR